MKRKGLSLLLLLLCLVSMTGCFWRKQVESYEIGFELMDGVSVNAIRGPGRYDAPLSWYAELKVVSVANQTITWQDPDLVTRDKQPIGLEVAVTYSRSRDEDTAVYMWKNYRKEATDDEELEKLVRTRIPRSAKAVTTNYTLDQMLGIAPDSSRIAVQETLFEALEPELAEIGCVLHDVGINNITVDEAYMNSLKKKSEAQVASEIAVQNTLKLIQELEQEKAQTEIELELARRENEVNRETAKAYGESPELLRLRIMELMSNMIGDSDKLIFLPEGADITLLFSAGDLIPLK